ncbi:MBL fold metallo-hydrolase [Desulfosudis oleivorans]|uniref:Beta-lactamase domain protein n=1 Tax=Desulfosudis oleivorans (strain DSM 6200 / JCM 39069 / Hxd3) TaxID=96561 RepID=A8ZT58_DESOH|nr:MBL fold metallo-hydrolase [Desulfosudis oleivorans]ABW67741.1 beta-lactamase domain protein [Desulfosudis oleivorans Hxd3]
MKLTLLYDNTAWGERLTPDWGFACLVEAHGRNILFDTGARGDILQNNMVVLGIAPDTINAVVISHDHWDHTGGLAGLLRVCHPTAIHVPSAFQNVPNVQVSVVEQPTELFPGIWSTGTLAGMEQSLVVVRPDGSTVVVAGCSHPGVNAILEAARRVGPVHALVGGLHGFEDFDAVKDIHVLCPTHCTQFISTIKSRYPHAYVEGGAGRVLDI